MGEWYVGMQVVCITQGIPSKMYEAARKAGCVYPMQGLVYTIREFGRFTENLILLEEIINPIPRGEKYEPGYNRKRFRPVKKTSIDIFRSLLTPTGQEGPASPVSPVRVALPSDLVQERGCHHADLLETRLSAGGTSLRPTAARLALKLDGAPLSHSVSSAVSSCDVRKNITGATTDAGYLLHPSEILSKFGQGTGRGIYCR